MTLPFNEKVVNDSGITKQSIGYPNFVGYLNPFGEELDYALPFGRGGHDNNPTTELFELFFYIRNQEFDMGEGWIIYTDEKCDELDKEFVEYRSEELNRMLERKKKYKLRSGLDKYELMDYDLLVFFHNCYSNGFFNKGLGKDVRLMDRHKFQAEFFYLIARKCLERFPRRENETYEQYEWRIPNRYKFDYQYEKYIDSAILDLLKETFISYMGYHSVERTPKTITTSSFNIYETFYNYLLNDFTIYQRPKMIWDDKLKMYVEHKQNEFLIPDSELRLKDEIESIRKRVPLNERHKYYR